MEERLIALAQGLVENPEAVRVRADEPDAEGSITYHVRVDAHDMGRVIGKQGKIAKAIRVIVRAAAARQHQKVLVEIDDERQPQQEPGAETGDDRDL
jgi:predicted RNA-binding protein YlqC (UPF0109 family)